MYYSNLCNKTIFALRLILSRICKYLCNPISPVWLGFKQINKRHWKCWDMLSQKNANKVLRKFILFLSLETHMILYDKNLGSPRPIIYNNMTWVNYLPFRTCSLSLWCMARLHWSLNGCLLRYCFRSEKQRVS